MRAYLAILLLIAAPAAGQTGRTADTGSGQVGQRQTRAQAAPSIRPLDRVDARLANRVQSRVRNRIDRYFDPQANAASPFRVAAEQARRPNARRR